MRQLVEALERAHGTQQPELIAPFEQVLWHNVAYLVDDDRRRAAFEALPSTDPKKLTKVKGLSERMRECVDIALSLEKDLGKLPLDQARKALMRFPGIAAPGADRILLIAGRGGTFAAESNGLRVLARVLEGHYSDGDYAKTYKRVLAAVSPEKDVALLRRATLVLKVHGQRICKRSKPGCDVCPAARLCLYAQLMRKREASAKAVLR